MNKNQLALAALLCCASCGAFAQAVVPAAAAPASDWTLTGNAGLFSDYRFRGFTQTGYKPAFQGGFDVAHSSGFYAGNWNSNVESGLYNGASLEMDFYGGYKRAFGDFGIDLGALYYYYPNSGKFANTTRINNGELYVGANYKMFSAKYYHGVTKFFALGQGPSLGAPGTGADVNTRGSGYLDLSAAFDLGNGWGLQAHYGYQRVRNGRQLFSAAGPIFVNANNVSDYKLGVSKDLSGWVVGAAIVGTSRRDFFRTAESNFTSPAGDTRAVVSLSKTF